MQARASTVRDRYRSRPASMIFTARMVRRPQNLHRGRRAIPAAITLGAIAAAFITGYGSSDYLNLSLFLAYASLFPETFYTHLWLYKKCFIVLV